MNEPATQDEIEYGSYSFGVELYRFYGVLVFGNTVKECEERKAQIWALNNPDDYYVNIDNGNYWGRYTEVISDNPDTERMPVMLINIGKLEKENESDHVDRIQNIIAHETIHCAMHILEHTGVKPTTKHHESLAYLHSYLMKEFVSCFRHYMKEQKLLNS